MQPETRRSASTASPRLRRALVSLVAASVLATAGAASAQTSDENKAAARALALQGADALKNGRPAEALDYVRRAETIMHAPTHLLLIARAEVGVGKLVSAQETYLRLLHEELAANAPAAFRNAQAAAKDELAAIEPRIASLRIVVDGAAQKKATVKLDDEIVPPVLVGVYRPVDPGKHVVAVYPIGGTPTKANIELHDGEKKEVKLAIADGPPPPGVPLNAADNPDALKQPDTGQQPPRDQTPGFFTPLRGAGLALGVVGVAGVAVGAVMLAQGFSAQSTANANAIKDGCMPPGGTVCPSSASALLPTNVDPFDKTAAKDKTIGGVLVPVGAVALGAGVALMIVGKPKPAAAPAHASVVPFFTGTGGGLRGTF